MGNNKIDDHSTPELKGKTAKQITPNSTDLEKNKDKIDIFYLIIVQKYVRRFLTTKKFLSLDANDSVKNQKNKFYFYLNFKFNN
jgi:hypothetical protein